ncbi:MAG: hypothetical protein K2L96_08070 [Muribaculaceae bacterium]|nr:hypothetical protein [Muribaculaceae bacterium]
MKKSRIIIIFLTALLAAGSLTGQQRRKLTDVLRPSESSLPERKTGIPHAPRNLKIVEKDDTIYCVATLNDCNGWQVPRDTITEEIAKKSAFSIRLTNKNKKGHFCRLEVLGYNLLPGSYSMTPTFVEMLPDECRNPEFATREISSMDLISDADGERVIESRSYDMDGRLLLTEIYMDYGAGTGMYDVKTLSELGLPATLAHLPENPDKAIREVVFYPDKNTSCSFFTATGEMVPLDDYGTFYIRQENIPEKGIKVTSFLDKDMHPIVGKKGYASEISTLYFSSIDSVMYLDSEGKLMNVAANAPWEDIRGVAKVVRRFDNEHKIVDVRYYDKCGRPTVNNSGIHKLSNEYDQWGNRVVVNNFDIFDELLKEGPTRFELVCDSLGRTLEYRVLDAEGNLCNNTNELCRFYNVYTADGRVSDYANYTIIDGKEVVTSYRKESKNRAEYLYEDGSTKTEIFDSKGRLLRAESLKDGVLDSDLTYPLIVYSYQEKDGKVVSEELAYRANGKLAYKNIRDSLAKTSIYEWFDSTGTWSHRYMQDTSVPEKMTYSFLNSYLKPARAANMNGATGYQLIFKPTLTGEWAERFAYDEFNEPDYHISSFGPVAHGTYPSVHNSDDEYYTDEYGNRIEDMDAFKTSKAKAISVEILDSVAYDIGFRDNDLIVAYGPEFKATIGETEGLFLAKWGVAEIQVASKTKKAKVFRIESTVPEKCSIVELELPTGTTRDYGITTYQRYLTDKQVERIADTGFRIKAPEESLPPYSAVVNIPVIPHSYYSQDYTELIGVPSLLVWVGVVEYPEMCWMHGESFDLLDQVLQFARPETGLHIRTCYFDGTKTIVNNDYQGVDVRLLEGHVNSNINSILNIYAQGEYNYEKGDYKALASHIAHLIRDTDLSNIQSREDMVAVYSKMFKYYDVLNSIKDKAPEEFLEGQVYMGYYAGLFGLKSDILLKAYLLPAMKAGVIKAGKFDLSSKLYSILSAQSKTDAEAKEYYDEFMKDKVFVYTVIEEPGHAAYDKGLRGEYVLLRSEDWTMRSPETWEEMRDRLKADKKHLYLLDPKGKIIETEIEGTMGVSMTLRSVSPKEYERITKLVDKVSKNLKRK